MSGGPGPPFRKLDRRDVDQVFEVMAAAAGSGVIPPGMTVSIDDALLLFDPPARPELDDVVGVFGASSSGDVIDGFIALAVLELDGAPYLEFYIFFRPGAPRPDIVGASLRLVRNARQCVPDPICTLIYPANERGKAFYSKVDFRFDRCVALEGMEMDMWLWHETPGQTHADARTENRGNRQ